MAKENQPTSEIKHLKDAIGFKWISIISISAFMAIGIWMILSPSKPEDSIIERRSVSTIKEMWSLEAGLIITGICLVLLYFPVKNLLLLSGKTWINWKTGYYLFDKKKRIQGGTSMYNGNDLIVFHPQSNVVFCLPKFHGTALGKYNKALVTNEFNCKDAFWSADENNFTLCYQGKKVNNTTSVNEGDELIVTSNELQLKFKLANYNNAKRYKIYRSEVSSIR